jgi:site-specific recombinase XerD
MNKNIQAYREYLRSQPLPGSNRIAAENTVKGYVGDLGRFAGWFEDTFQRAFTPEAITRDDIQDYLDYLREEKERAVSTVSRIYASIASFCRWALITDRVQYNESVGVKLPNQQFLAPKGLNRLQRRALRRALTRADKYTAKSKRRLFRDRAIVFTLMYVGLRVSEIENMRLGDVTIRERSGEILVRSGKGDKDRIAAIPLDARKALSTWIEEKRPETEHDYVLVALRKQYGVYHPLGTRSIQAMTRKLGKKAGLEEEGVLVTPHLLRHTAVHLWRQKNSAFVVAAQMGHKDINTTMSYDRPSQADLRRGAAKVR